jgi:hypothetical protein
MKIIAIKRGHQLIRELICFFGEFTWKDIAICGGFARWCLSPVEEPKPYDDIDIYCPNTKAFDMVVSYLKSNDYKVRHENQAAITYEERNNIKLQVIKPLIQGQMVTVGDRETILSNFDFTVCRASVINDQEGMVDDDFEEDEIHHYLRLKKIHCPVSSAIRCMKYGSKGYFIRPGEVMKLFADWDARSPEYKLELLDWLHSLEDEGEMTEEEIQHLESLLRID